MKYEVELAQTVIESTTLYIEAHNQEQAELIAEYIAENGKDPWDRKRIEVTWQTIEVHGDIEVITCEQESASERLALPPACNTLPEHTEGLFADEPA
ncbi:MAG TPA: hypothetical protein VGH47_15935 [Xanthobacteraceae bacterium]|jgi:hypothetical protein